MPRRQREEAQGSLSRLRYDFLEKSLQYGTSLDEAAKRELLEEMDFILDLYRRIEARMMVAGLAEAMGKTSEQSGLSRTT
jgi:hypothetical protein